MAAKALTIAQIEANRANVLVGFALYLEDPREYVSDGSLTHGLNPAFRAESTRGGNPSATLKNVARAKVARCPYSDRGFLVEQRWCAKGRHCVESVRFAVTAKRVSKA